ncbi:hypothetical protein [Streptomyces sp. NBC_00102]|uniref:hypothetical protein n=1 Tax=Streptomyces sp. NBC_00102 TaxID=2975652 RepID=UPI0022514982|nr:hypothetical protein [Streptomyces sp. NBC_00102]MCX5397370.1 hypothetical protein [Streptomyces sp. NBC_00102]
MAEKLRHPSTPHSSRARREGRSEQELVVEAVRDAQNRAGRRVDDVMAELMESDAEILHHLR